MERNMKEEKGKAIFIQILISYVTTLQTKGGRPRIVILILMSLSSLMDCVK